VPYQLKTTKTFARTRTAVKAALISSTFADDVCAVDVAEVSISLEGNNEGTTDGK